MAPEHVITLSFNGLVIRRLINSPLAGFHTFDYARHFMSCCSRMLGLEHVASRGSISIEYYGRNVGIKIMPTGVKPERYLNGFGWQDTIWRRGELLSQVRFSCHASKSLCNNCSSLHQHRG